MACSRAKFTFTFTFTFTLYPTTLLNKLRETTRNFSQSSRRPTGIRTRHLLNTNLKRYHLTKFSWCWIMIYAACIRHNHRRLARLIPRNETTGFTSSRGTTRTSSRGDSRTSNRPSQIEAKNKLQKTTLMTEGQHKYLRISGNLKCIVSDRRSPGMLRSADWSSQNVGEYQSTPRNVQKATFPFTQRRKTEIVHCLSS
jgi:hypothetical protein